MYKYGLLVYKPRVFVLVITTVFFTYSSIIPHKTLAYTAETIQVLYFDFTKAIV